MLWITKDNKLLLNKFWFFRRALLRFPLEMSHPASSANKNNKLNDQDISKSCQLQLYQHRIISFNEDYLDFPFFTIIHFINGLPNFTSKKIYTNINTLIMLRMIFTSLVDIEDCYEPFPCPLLAQQDREYCLNHT